MKKSLTFLVILIHSNILLASKLYCSDEVQGVDVAPMPMMFDPDAMDVEEEFVDLMNQEVNSVSSAERTIPTCTSVTSVSVASPRVFSSVTKNVTNSISGGSMGYSRVLTDEEVLLNYKDRASRAQASGDEEITALLVEASKQLEHSLEYKYKAEQVVNKEEGNPSVDPPVEYARRSSDNQSSFDRARSSELQFSSSISHLPSPTTAAVSPVFGLIRSTGRIVTKEASCLRGASSSARLIAFSLDNIVEYLLKVRSQDRENSEIITLWRRAITQKQLTIAYYRQSIEAYISGDEEKGDRLGRHWPSGSASWAAELSTRKLITAAEYLNKSQHAGNSEIAILFTRAAEQCQVASEYFHQAAQSAALGHENEGKRWSRMGCSTSDRSQKLADAAHSLTKVQTAENSENAARLVNEAKQFKAAAEYYAQAVQAYAANNKEEGKRYDQKAMRKDPSMQSLFQSGFCGFGGVQQEVNALEEEGASEVEDASVKSLTVGKQLNPNNALKYNALKIYCEHWLAEIGVTQEGESSYADKALERGAYPQLVESFKKYCEEIKVSLDSGGLLALSWIQVAEAIQQGMEDSIQAKNAPENSKLATYWSSPYFRKNIVNTTKQLAQFKAEMMRATLLHQTPKIVNEWKKIVELSHSLAVHYSKGVEAAVIGEEEEYILFDYNLFEEDDDTARSGAVCLKTAATALKRASEAEKNREYSILRKTSEQHQIAAEYYQRAAKAHAQENKKESDRFHYAASSIERAACNLNQASGALEKAFEAEKNGKCSIADLWIKSSEQYQVAADYCRQYAEASMLQKSEECQRSHNLKRYTDYTYLEQTISAACRSACRLEGAITALERASEAEKRGGQAEEALLIKSSEQRQIAAEYYRKASEACAVENRQNYSFFTHLGEAYYESAKLLSEAASWLEKASEAEKGEQAVANLWKESAEQHQIAIDYKIKASEAKRLGNEEECTLFEHSANAIHHKIKADEARILGKEVECLCHEAKAYYAENSVKEITKNLSKRKKFSSS